MLCGWLRVLLSAFCAALSASLNEAYEDVERGPQDEGRDEAEEHDETEPIRGLTCEND